MLRRERNRADAMASLREDLLLLVAAMSGEFDSRIDELVKVRNELRARKDAATTLDEANKVLEKAKAYEAGVMAKAAEYDKKFKTLSENVAKQETIVNAAMDDLKRREAELVRMSDDLIKRTKEFDAHSVVIEAALKNRAEKLEKGEAALTIERAEVASLKETLNSRLDALRAA